MIRSWTFTGLEFYVLWNDTVGDSLPEPFVYTNRMKTQDDFIDMRFEVREHLRYTLDDEFRSEVLAALVRPDLWLTVSGWDGVDFNVPEKLTRLRAVRRGQCGYVIEQTVGETFWDAKAFTITECDAIALANAVVAAMPEQRAGQQGDIVLPDREEPVSPGSRHVAELDYSVGESVVNDSFDEGVFDRGRRFLAKTPVRTGVIDIVQGYSLYGPRGTTGYRLEWRDLEDDGRYVVDDQNPPVATAVDTAKLTAMINTRVAAVVHAIKDERA